MFSIAHTFCYTMNRRHDSLGISAALARTSGRFCLWRMQLPGFGLGAAPMAGTTVAWLWPTIERRLSVRTSRANSRPVWLSFGYRKTTKLVIDSFIMGLRSRDSERPSGAFPDSCVRSLNHSRHAPRPSAIH